MLETEVENAALAGNAHSVLDIEFSLTEWRGDLVLDHLHADTVTDRLCALLQRLDATNVESLRAVELQRATTWLRFG